MNGLLNDFTSRIYIVDLLVSAYGAGLFFWWWFREGGASAVFAYVAFLFIGEFCETSFALYARILMFFSSIDAYREYLVGPWWPMRKMLTLTVFICIVVHMSIRAFGKKE